jgi:hypothetical protein
MKGAAGKTWDVRLTGVLEGLRRWHEPVAVLDLHDPQLDGTGLCKGLPGRESDIDRRGSGTMIQIVSKGTVDHFC